jgi:hypothetical protein
LTEHRRFRPPAFEVLVEPTATQRSGYVRDGIYPAPSGRAIGGIAEAGRAPNDAGATASRSCATLRVASRSKGPAAGDVRLARQSENRFSHRTAPVARENRTIPVRIRPEGI